MNTLDVRIRNMIVAVLAVLTLFLLIQSISSIAGIKEKGETYPSNVITVRGDGEAVGTPDIATFTFTVREEAKDIAAAQQVMVDKANKAIAYLKEQGIEAKDIKTEGYYTNPKYDYTYQAGVPSRQILTGYEVSETISVKVRQTEKAGTILTGITNLKITEVSSLTFTIDDIDSLKVEAKKQAIENAKTEAQRIADALGVDLEGIVGFYEEYPYIPYEYGYGGDMSMSAVKNESVAPDLQAGEQKVTASVTITYEIED